MRAAVYIDQAFWRDGDAVYAARSFVIFLGQLAEELDELTVAARLAPTPGTSHHRLPPPARFEPLPHYQSAANPVAVARAARESIRRFDALLDDVDAVWLLGPQPLAIAFALMARRRGRRVALGVRQDLPRYVRNRRRGRIDLQLAAFALDAAFRLLARRTPTIVVGPHLARRYRRAARLLEIYVSLIRAGDIDTPPPATRAPLDGDGPVRVLTVGRIDAEKNPLMLAEVLERLDPRFRLVVCGEGPLEADLADAFAARGLSSRVELLGHVPMGPELLSLYRDSDVFLHVSWTEGVPQVLLEAFAAALPTVATDVGGVGGAVGDGAVLVPPGDPKAAADAVARVAGDAELRRSLTQAAGERIRVHTLDAEARRVAAFLGRL